MQLRFTIGDLAKLDSEEAYVLFLTIFSFEIRNNDNNFGGNLEIRIGSSELKTDD